MFYVYVLRSAKKKYHYIGSTEDLKRRLEEHNQGKTKSIRHLVPFELLYYEAYVTKVLARKRELELKNNSFKKKVLFDRLEK
ncbi:MAG: GIY-YIG nuclease family protein [Candidatus Moranbacteria bacterium]|nr:GIY-YIG nuclease family protein [Candidatus Moranbacteria bacterium]